MLCVAKNNNEYVEVTPVKVVKDNCLLNAIKGINSYNTTNYPFELTADMFDENSTEIYNHKYYNNKNIIKVEIPNNIKKINAYAFASCSRLTSVAIGNGVTSIVDDAFNGCSSLTSITIPNSVKSIGTRAFNGCSSLTSITIPNSVTSMGGAVFFGCSSLTSITIPNSVKSIGYNVFRECYRLQIVDFRSATQVPTVQSDSFMSVPKTCKFIIPDSLYDSWITSTNWVSLYNKGYQFIKASEYTEA